MALGHDWLQPVAADLIATPRVGLPKQAVCGIHAVWMAGISVCVHLYCIERVECVCVLWLNVHKLWVLYFDIILHCVVSNHQDSAYVRL